MIKDFLIISCIGKDDKFGLKINNEFYIYDFDKKVNKNDQLVEKIVSVLNKHNVDINSNFSVMVNSGPGSFLSSLTNRDVGPSPTSYVEVT